MCENAFPHTHYEPISSHFYVSHTCLRTKSPKPLFFFLESSQPWRSGFAQLLHHSSLTIFLHIGLGLSDMFFFIVVVDLGEETGWWGCVVMVGIRREMGKGKEEDGENKKIRKSFREISLII